MASTSAMRPKSAGPSVRARTTPVPSAASWTANWPATSYLRARSTRSDVEAPVVIASAINVVRAQSCRPARCVSARITTTAGQRWLNSLTRVWNPHAGLHVCAADGYRTGRAFLGPRTAKSCKPVAAPQRTAFTGCLPSGYGAGRPNFMACWPARSGTRPAPSRGARRMGCGRSAGSAGFLAGVACRACVKRLSRRGPGGLTPWPDQGAKPGLDFSSRERRRAAILAPYESASGMMAGPDRFLTHPAPASVKP